jgi:hypothetical protein
MFLGFNAMALHIAEIRLHGLVCCCNAIESVAEQGERTGFGDGSVLSWMKSMVATLPRSIPEQSYSSVGVTQVNYSALLVLNSVHVWAPRGPPHL